MLRGKWKRMTLVMAADGDGGDSVDFGNFFGGGGATKNAADDQVDDQDQIVDDVDDTETEDDTDGDFDEQDGDDGDDSDDGDADDETDDADPTTISMAAIKQQQEILADLLRQKKEQEVAPQEEVAPEVDPFESEEFSRMVEVMNWDEDEAKAAKVFFQKFMDWGNKKAFDRFSQETPQMVETTIQRADRIKQARKSFYESHPVLTEVKPFVAQIAQGVAQEMGQGATMEAVLEESAKRAYKALGVDPAKLGALADRQERQGKKKPAFPVKKGARKQVTKPPKLQQEIDAVIGI